MADVYRCPNWSYNGCEFYLWEEDVEKRKHEIELANSQREPRTPSQSPSRRSSARVGGLLTPGTGREPRSRRYVAETPTRTRRTTYVIDDSEDEEYNYGESESLDNENVDNFSGDESFHNTNDDNGDESSDSSSDDENDGTGMIPWKTRSDDLADKSSPTPNQTSRTSRKRTFEDFTVEPPPYSETASASQSAEASTTRRRIRSSQRSPAHLSALSSNVLSILDSHDVVFPTDAWDEIAAFLDLKHQTNQGVNEREEHARGSIE